MQRVPLEESLVKKEPNLQSIAMVSYLQSLISPSISPKSHWRRTIQTIGLSFQNLSSSTPIQSTRSKQYQIKANKTIVEMVQQHLSTDRIKIKPTVKTMVSVSQVANNVNSRKDSSNLAKLKATNKMDRRASNNSNKDKDKTSPKMLSKTISKTRLLLRGQEICSKLNNRRSQSKKTTLLKDMKNSSTTLLIKV